MLFADPALNRASIVGKRMMSADLEVDTMMCCASCGKAEVDEVKLKKCDGCNLVKYCSVECQKDHRPQHKKACKEKAAEIHDDKLFTQPDESHHGECPICCLPLPLDENKSGINSCCCKRICLGCSYANMLRELEQAQYPKCAFCREPMPKTMEEINHNLMKRVKANDPDAIFKMGVKCYEQGDYDGAFQYYKKAAGLGHMDAHYNISIIYGEGHGIEKDIKKKIYHLEEAAIGGHHFARYNLACYAGQSGKHDKAMKHFMIVANLGDDGALDKVKQGFVNGIVSKDDYASTLRGHQAAVDATKSKQREEAYAFYAQTATWN